MTAPHRSNLPHSLEEAPVWRLSAALDIISAGGQSVLVQPMLPGVPGAAWENFDVQAGVMRELDQDADPALLAQSVAGVVAASAGAEYDFSDTAIGPRGRGGPFATKFSKRLAAIADISPDDEKRNSLIDQCEGDLERYLREVMRNKGLAPSGQRSAEDQVWAFDRQTGVWAAEPLRDRAALLSTVAVHMFTAALAGRPSDQARFRSLLPTPPRRFVFPVEDAARAARDIIDR